MLKKIFVMGTILCGETNDLQIGQMGWGQWSFHQKKLESSSTSGKLPLKA